MLLRFDKVCINKNIFLNEKERRKKKKNMNLSEHHADRHYR